MKPQRIHVKRLAENTAAILVIIFTAIAVVIIVWIARRHDVQPPQKTVTITGFQGPLMLGYSFLDSQDKLNLSAQDKVDIRQDLGVKATVTTYQDGKTPTTETADVWMWRRVQ